MAGYAVPRIPLIEDLTSSPVPSGSNILVEFDPSTQWYNAALTIAAGWLKTGGRISYNVMAQPVDNIRSQLKRLGLNVKDLENDDKLRIRDWYSASIGRKSTEKIAENSLKVADLSIRYGREVMAGQTATGRPPVGADWLRIMDNASGVARFNDEKTWVEFRLSRANPSAHSTKSTGIAGVVNGFHSGWVYKALEAASDGIVDFKLEESGSRLQNLIRVRNMLNVRFDSNWHRLKIADNLEVTME